MRRWVLGVLACVAVSAPLAADTVYTRDGKIHRGTVTRDGNKYIVELADGKTIELLAGQVLHVTRGATGTPKTTDPKTPPTGTKRPPRDPKTPAGPPKLPSALTLGKIRTFPPPVQPRLKVYSVEGSSEPEPVIFMLLRNTGMPGGIALVDMHTQLGRWRILAHERRRRVLGNWLSPKDFVKHREAYQKLLEQAREAHRTARTNKRKYTSGSKYSPYGSSRKTPQQLPSSVVSKLQQAANSWGDSTVRAFLSGILRYQTGNYTRAATLFRTCCAEAPRVAGFYQGYGLSLTELGQHKLALAAYVQVVRLRPDSRDAVKMLYQGMGRLPGGMVSSAVYEEAERLLAQYDEATYKTKSYSSSTSMYRRPVTYLMPGRTWRGATNSLPVPPFDRLTFRQGLGVPVANTTLLVEAECVRDAVEVFVQMAPNLVVPARVRQVSSYRRKKEAPVPLTAVSVQGFAFAPITMATEDENKPTKGQKVLVHALGLYEEMGSRPRTLPGQIEAVSDDGKCTVSARLAAGHVTAPVLTQNGALVGFLAGKTNVRAAGGGKDVFIPLSAIEPLTKRATRGVRSYGGGYSSAKRKTTPIVVTGKVFPVYATKTELFK